MNEIKSKRAKELIECSYFRSDFSKNYEKDPTLRRDYMAKTNASLAVIFAEQEAEERYLEQIKQIEIRAVETHKATCINMGCQSNTTFRNGFGNNKCSGNCEYVTQFTQKLNDL